MCQPIKVLLVDDERNIRITLKNLFYEFNCVFTEAGSGEEAFGKISKEYFDVIFFDNKLRGDDGIETIREIRACNLPVGNIILMTGYPEENTREEAKELDVRFLSKKTLMDFEEMTALFKEAITTPAPISKK